MKKLLLVAVAAVSVSLVSNAQIKKGTVLAGGGFSVGTSVESSSSSAPKNRYLNINPSIGIAVKENRILGINLYYGSNRAKFSNPSNRYETHNYGGGVSLRPYLPLGKNFYLFGEAGVNYNYSRQEQVIAVDNAYYSTGQGATAYLQPGVSYVVKDRFHLEIGLTNLVSLGYIHSKNESITFGGRNETKQSNFGLSTSAGGTNPLFVGFRIALGKRK